MTITNNNKPMQQTNRMHLNPNSHVNIIVASSIKNAKRFLCKTCDQVFFSIKPTHTTSDDNNEQQHTDAANESNAFESDDNN
jgi:hypothetical protein